MKNPCEAVSQASPNAPKHVGPERCFRKILANREMGENLQFRTDQQMGLSKNNGTPQIIHSNRVFHYKHKPSILGYPYFWKHPNPQSIHTFHHSTLMLLMRSGTRGNVCQAQILVPPKPFKNIQGRDSAGNNFNQPCYDHQKIPCLPVLPPMLLGCLRPASIDNSVDFPDPFFPTMPTLNKNCTSTSD